MANLYELNLGYNQLTGSIPPELWELPQLGRLELGGNQLTGSIPVEIGNLPSGALVDLGDNQFTGSIPPELGDSNVRWLTLWGNQLTGPIPPELGSATNLERLFLQANADLSGSLPRTFLGLHALEALRFEDTQVCAPADAEFQRWISGLPDYSGKTCASGALPSDRTGES